MFIIRYYTIAEGYMIVKIRKDTTCGIIKYAGIMIPN